MNSARPALGETMTAVGAAGLVLCLILTEWFGVIRPPTSPDSASTQIAVGAWRELKLTPWLLLAAVVISALSVAAAHARRTRGQPGAAGLARLSLAVASVASVILFDRVLIDLPSPGSVDDVKLGAYLALLSIVAVALGGYVMTTDRRLVTEGQADPPSEGATAISLAARGQSR